MEKVLDTRKKSLKYVKLAEHMLTHTYPFVQDSKLLLSIVEYLFLALTNGIGSLLYYERIFKRVPPFNDTFQSKLYMFENTVAKRYKIQKKDIDLMKEIRMIIVERKNSPVEFPRKDGFVICTEDYKTRVITPKQLRIYINNTKLFIEELINIVEKDDGRRIFTINT